MKKIYFLACFILLAFIVSAQSISPYINYQGVARSSSGIPIIGNIGVKLQLHQGAQNGSIVFTEPHTVTTNSFGVFNLLIGSQNSSGFAGINWGQGPYYLEVSIDPNGGTSYTSITNQIFASVPYALYAENAKTTSITTSPNLTVTSLGINSFSISAPQLVAGSNFSITPIGGNVYQLDAAGSSTSALWSSSSNNVYLSSGGNNVGIGTNTPSAKLEVNASSSDGIKVTSGGGNGIFVTTNASLPSVAAVSAINNGQGNGVTGSVISSNSLIAGVKGTNGGIGPAVYGINSASGAGIFGENSLSASSSNAHGVWGKTINQAPYASGVLGESYGNGPGVYGYQGGSNTGSTSHGVFGMTNSSAAAGVFGTNSSVIGGPAIYGLITSGSSSATSHGVRGETNAITNLAAGVFGENKGQGAGVFGISSNNTNSTDANGVKGITNSPNSGAAGVYGENQGAGASVVGVKTAASSLGNAARFEIFNNASNAEAVYVSNLGTGMGVYSNVQNNYAIRGINNSAAVAAISANNLGTSFSLYAEKIGTQTGEVTRFTNLNSANANPVLVVSNSGNSPAVNVTAATTSTVLMQFNDGHLKSMGLAPAVTTFSNVGGITTVTYSLTTCTDIKGNILAVATTTGIINIGGYATIRVAFNKSYITPPIVVITPTTDFGSMSYFISNVTPTAFFVTIKNNTATNISGSSFNWGFNYMVIE